jgi:cell division transport system permease protein
VKLSLIGFVCRRVCGSLWQSLWTHVLTAGTVALTLFVFGAFMLLEINLQNLLKSWGDQIQITAYLSAGSNSADVGALIKRIEALPEVGRVRHTSQEQAWRDFQIALGSQSTLLEGLPREVLPASIEISLKSAHRDASSVEIVAQRLKQERQISSVEYPQEWIERLGLIVLIVGWVKWIFGGVLFLATFFIVGSTVKLAILARRDEVEIMQLVGASEELIQAPFVIEGMIQGLAGAAIATAALGAAYALLARAIGPVAGLLSPAGALEFLPVNSMGMLLAIGSFLGAAGSLISLRRFVRTWHASSARG